MLDVALVGMIEFIIDERLQDTRLCKIVLHLEIALLMELIWGYPDECHLIIIAVCAFRKFTDNTGQHLRCHHCLAGSGWSLENNLLSLASAVEKSYGL